jgi:hypothetical protein
MSKQTESSLFIFPSFKQSRAFYQELLSGIVSYEGFATRILKQIEAAHAFRQLERVAELARILVNVPIRQYQIIGQYYLAWCKCRAIQYQPDELERLAEQSRTYKAKALISRAALEVFQAQFERALYFYGEAIKANHTISDFIVASRGIATVKSLEGFDASALRDLEQLTPLLRYAEPLNYFEVVNSYAVELLANNRLTEAQNVSVIAISSPFGRFYPEWQETWYEVRSKRKRRSTVTISRPLIEQEDEAEPEAPEPTVRNLRIQTVIDFMNSHLDRRVFFKRIGNRSKSVSVSLFAPF